jgi:CDGSH-type Zn-finger protein
LRLGGRLARVSEPRIEIEAGGPYRVSGSPSLRRVAQDETEYGEPVGWSMGATVGADEPCRLCRCGLSQSKPSCDDACAEAGFEGTETADRAPSAGRRKVLPGDGVVMTDDQSLCSDAGYCGDRFTNVWNMIRGTGDADVRDRLIRMVALCPSGRLAYSLPGDPTPVEPSFEPSIWVQDDGPLVVRGGIPIVAADGEPYEVRNRMTLCRCGRSDNKPFCDGSHKKTGFRDS